MSSYKLFDPDLTKRLPLPEQGSWPESSHCFDKRSVWAVRAAIASKRPLLLRGEPGIGKSQLARAVAAELNVPFLPHVVDERTERDELFYSFDAVARLAQAQVSGLAAKQNTAAQQNTPGTQSFENVKQEDWQSALAERNYFRPGVLWWAYNWDDAKTQTKLFSQHCRAFEERPKPKDWTPGVVRPCGPVVLIDEIDKADPLVPNGLLECLGNQGFETAQLGTPIRLPVGAKPPLVIITTNEDRELPAAFLRRCLVLQMHFPKTDAEATTFLLDERARIFWEPKLVSDVVCKEVARVLLSERTQAIRNGNSVPGAAEYLDILRVLVELHPSDEDQQLTALTDMSDFALKKSRDGQR